MMMMMMMMMMMVTVMMIMVMVMVMVMVMMLMMLMMVNLLASSTVCCRPSNSSSRLPTHSSNSCSGKPDHIIFMSGTITMTMMLVTLPVNFSKS